MQNMSLVALAQLIGRKAQFTTQDGLVMPVEIVDVKSAWGNQRYVIADSLGHQITVDARRVDVAEVAA